jgi:hypothetical protein
LYQCKGILLLFVNQFLLPMEAAVSLLEALSSASAKPSAVLLLPGIDDELTMVDSVVNGRTKPSIVT